jgi:hypothetical protein
MSPPIPSLRPSEAREFLAGCRRTDFQFTATAMSEEARQRAGFTMRSFQGSFDEHEDALQRLNQLECDIRVQLAAMDGGNVASIPAYYALLYRDAVTNLRRFDLAPDMLISASAINYYAFWFSGDIDLREFPHVQEMLAMLIEGDRAVTDLRRNVPLPGFVNYSDLRCPHLVSIQPWEDVR